MGFVRIWAVVWLVIGTGAAHAQTDAVERGMLQLITGTPERYAFVVGNGSYDNVPDLENTIADAKLVATFLGEIGYTVFDSYELDKREFEEAMQSFMLDVQPDTDVVFYFAGHGVQIGDENFLMPTDVALETAYDVPFEAVSLTSVLQIMGSRARSMVVILDSCRDNPFAGRTGVVGLAEIEATAQDGFAAERAPINSLLVFSTSPGALAYDGGEAGNSPFTASFVEIASRERGEPVDTLMKSVRREVYERTEGLQLPWEASSLIEPVFLGGGPLGARAPLPGRTVSGDAASAVAAVLDDTVTVTSDASDITVRTPLSDAVPVGAHLADTLSVAPGSLVNVSQSPKRGRLMEVLPSSGTRGLVLLNAATLRLDRMVYKPAVNRERAAGLEAPVIADSFSVTVAGEAREVEVQLEIDPCDFHAGDHLDADGVGVARYPNEIEPEAARAACLAAVAAAPDVGRFHYQLGRAELALRDFEAAERAFQTAAQLRHARAFHALGALIIDRRQATEGQARSAAPADALGFFEEGVALGDPYAMHSLGLDMLKFGASERDRTIGFELLMRSLELGHTFSMNALGLYFLDEDGPNHSPERGVSFLRASAERGDIYGYANMGFLHLNGLGGVAQDNATAFDWFRRASDEGHPTAPSSIGRMYNSGQIDGRPNYTAAVEWYDIGLERGDAWGGANAAWIIANRAPSGFVVGDAAVRAAKAMALRNDGAEEAARQVLQGLPRREIDAGAQRLLSELGQNVVVDGQFGPQSRAALAAVGAASAGDDPVARVLALAALYWRASPFRPDLY